MATSIVQQILEEVERLPLTRQQEVLRYLRGMEVDRQAGTKRASVKARLQDLGPMSREDAEEMMRVIEEGCGMSSLKNRFHI